MYGLQFVKNEWNQIFFSSITPFACDLELMEQPEETRGRSPESDFYVQWFWKNAAALVDTVRHMNSTTLTCSIHKSPNNGPRISTCLQTQQLGWAWSSSRPCKYNYKLPPPPPLQLNFPQHEVQIVLSRRWIQQRWYYTREHPSPRLTCVANAAVPFSIVIIYVSTSCPSLRR